LLVCGRMPDDTPKLVAPHIERLTPYVPGMPPEELERQFGVRGAIKLASNENALGPSPLALAAAQAALREGHRYPDQHRLRAALAAHHGVTLEEVILGNGTDELLGLVARTFGRAGERAVFPAPSFPTYALATGAMGMQARVVPLQQHIEYDLEAMLEAVRGEARLFFLANPNNPTGAHLTRPALSQLLSALAPGTIAVLDEAYVEFADAPDFASGLQLRELHEHTLVLRTFSKAYGLAGLRVGYGIGTPAVIGYLERLRPPFNVSNVALAAAEAALADGAHLARYVAHNRRERARVRQGLATLGMEVAPSQTNFLLVRANAPLLRTGRVLVDALSRRGVITRPMPAPIADWLRITIGSEAENDRLLATMGELLEPRGT
jgi:histidinol-phosphate aminotransferase